MCVSLCGRGHIALHFDWLHWFVMGFLGQRNGKEIKASFQSQAFVPVSTQWTKLPSALFSPCFYWFFGHHDEHPTQPLGHFMVCRSSCNKTLEMERWKGDSKGGEVLTRFSLPCPTVLMLMGPIQQLLPRLWLPTGPRVSITNDPRGSKNRSCPSLCWHDDP